jgi:hypothetical protein
MPFIRVLNKVKDHEKLTNRRPHTEMGKKRLRLGNLDL